MALFEKETYIEEPFVNLTPLIDVVFVVLIVFMVIAPMLETDQIELASASHAEKGKKTITTEEMGPISIHVKKDNDIYLNGEKLNLEQLKKKLISLKKMYPEVSPKLFHDKKASFGTYQSVKNALEFAGFYKMDVLLAP